MLISIASLAELLFYYYYIIIPFFFVFVCVAFMCVRA